MVRRRRRRKKIGNIIHSSFNYLNLNEINSLDDDVELAAGGME